MEQELYYSISDEVFERFPTYVRGVVLAYGLSNGASPRDLVALLRAAEQSARERLQPTAIAEYPRIKAWREAFRAFGAKPSEYRSSIEAMARRVLRGDALPSINALVDIGNVMSLQHLVPAGGHAMDALTQDLVLRPATGTEEFVALDGIEIEHPEPGEIVFAEGNRVLTRRWVWRQGTYTLLRPETTAMELNVDGLPPATAEEVQEICRNAAALVERYCGGRTRIEMLSAGKRRIRLSE